MLIGSICMANREPAKADVLQGTLDLMVLQTVATLGPLHGYAIAARLEQVSGGALRLNMGTLYPGLMRLEQRGQRGLPWLGDLARDLRYGCRMLAKNPGFAIVSVMSLAIGVGANAAVFSVADALMLRPLAVPRPGDVLTVGSTASVEVSSNLVASYREYIDVRDRSKTFAGLVGFTAATVGFATDPDTSPKRRLGMLVSGNFFTVMAVEPQLGRTFRPDEDQVPGRDAVVVLGHDFWEQQFGGDRTILGRRVRLNGIEFTVV